MHKKINEGQKQVMIYALFFYKHGFFSFFNFYYVRLLNNKKIRPTLAFLCFLLARRKFFEIQKTFAKKFGFVGQPNGTQEYCVRGFLHPKHTQK
jgi:hypothetical protein